MAASPRIPVFKLIVWSLVIGLVLALFNVSPKDIYAWAGEMGGTVFTWLWTFGQTIGPYIVMGAMVVLPVWGATFLWNKFK